MQYEAGEVDDKTNDQQAKNDLPQETGDHTGTLSMDGPGVSIFQAFWMQTLLSLLGMNND